MAGHNTCFQPSPELQRWIYSGRVNPNKGFVVFMLQKAVIGDYLLNQAVRGMDEMRHTVQYRGQWSCNGVWTAVFTRWCSVASGSCQCDLDVNGGYFWTGGQSTDNQCDILLPGKCNTNTHLIRWRTLWSKKDNELVFIIRRHFFFIWKILCEHKFSSN